MARNSRPILPTFPLPAHLSLIDACREAINQLYEDVIAFHEDALAEDGGAPGFRDRDALAAAVARPFTFVGGRFAFGDGLLQATILLKSLAQYHAFTDGNKRTALTACLYFLAQCGYWPHALLVTRGDLARLETFVEWLSNERKDIEAGASPHLYDPDVLARRLHTILAPTRLRRPRLARLLSREFHVIWVRHGREHGPEEIE